MEVTAFDPVTNSVIAPGVLAPSSMKVDVTIPAEQQMQLPVFQDILMMMTVRWTNEQYASNDTTDDIVFQNLLYTFKFEPLANELQASLVANQAEIIRGETLILDASDSVISNMPEAQLRRSLAYEWKCPNFLEAYCGSQSGSQLLIPFSSIKDTSIFYEVPYEFTVTVIWAKPDGADERSQLSTVATWYDLEIPEFQITYEPTPILLTATQNTLFYLEALNFAIDDIRDYEVTWALEPALPNPSLRTVLSGGRIMQIVKGAYARNTLYTVTLTVQSKKLAKVTHTEQIEFQTKSEPVQGTISVTPFRGYVGDEFTVLLQEWSSDNLPLVYNVFSTYDTEGNRKGLLINDAPIPISEAFTFVAERTTPIIISVSDASGETLEFVMTPEILAERPPEDPDTNDEADTTDLVDANFLQDGETFSPLNLLTDLKAQKNINQRVSYMQTAIATNQKISPQQDTPVVKEDQIRFRKELLVEMESQIKAYQS